MLNSFFEATIGMIGGGVILLLMSLVPVRAIIQQLPAGKVRNRWISLSGFIFLFISGYVSYIFRSFIHRPEAVLSISALVVPGIFLGGAIFVYMVCSLSLETAIDLRRIFLLEQETITDPLMGIYNRRYFDRRLAEEILRSKRYELPFSIFLLDIDFFKKVNDTYGHQIGDMVLKKLATVIVDSVRETDVVIRYGGEEILVLQPNTRVANAVELAERLCRKVEETELVKPNPGHEQPAIHVTVSIGVAGYRFSDDLDSAERVVERADQALYQAKNQGRNRVVCSNDHDDLS